LFGVDGGEVTLVSKKISPIFLSYLLFGLMGDKIKGL
jgi:hypothetical protein